MKALNGSDVAETWIACEQWTGVGRTAAVLSESNDDVMHIDDSVSEGSITDNKHVRRSEERSEWRWGRRQGRHCRQRRGWLNAEQHWTLVKIGSELSKTKRDVAICFHFHGPPQGTGKFNTL